MASSIQQVEEHDLEVGHITPVANANRSCVAIGGDSIDQVGKKQHVKQVTGCYNNTELHLASQHSDLDGKINSQIGDSLSKAELEVEAAQVRALVVNEANELGETALFMAAEKGHLDMVKELLKYANKDTLTRKNRAGFDPLQVAVKQGHLAIVQVLLDHDPELIKTVGPSNATPLITASTMGHTPIVHELLSRDSSLVESCKSNGKNALHIAARKGHVDIVKTLLDKDPMLTWKTDKKGQTALHMAVKGNNRDVVRALLDADAGIVMRTGKFGTPALHVATRKKRAELQQTRKTNKNVSGVAKELRKLHREGIKNATNSGTDVAVLFATVAFSAIFTVPGGDDNNGIAVAAKTVSFKIFFMFNAIALFTSLAVVVIQVTLVRSETKVERWVVEVVNKLMWLASVCTAVAFMASSYIVVGQHHEWAAILVTVVGGVIMGGVLATTTYYVAKSKRSHLGL